MARVSLSACSEGNSGKRGAARRAEFEAANAEQRLHAPDRPSVHSAHDGARCGVTLSLLPPLCVHSAAEQQQSTASGADAVYSEFLHAAATCRCTIDSDGDTPAPQFMKTSQADR